MENTNWTPDTDPIHCVNEVSEITHLPPGTLRYYRHQGIGPRSFKVGRRVMYRRSVVLAWLGEQELADPRTGPAA
jgi:DNA-binding transcriptional MerR regulator